jgi:uncharacterized membrane protein YgcG
MLRIRQKKNEVRLFLGAFLFFAVFFLTPVQAQTPTEYIDAFSAHIEVYKNGTFKVTEEITYVSLQEKHGIYRCIPTVHHEQATSFLKERYIDIAIQRVYEVDHDVPFVIDNKRNEVCVRIGDPDIVQTGERTFTIEYLVSGGLTYPKNGDPELYWNVTGVQWALPIKTVVAQVSSPDGLLQKQHACYRGKYGKTDSCKSIQGDDEKVIFSDGTFFVGESITIAQGLNGLRIERTTQERYKSFFVTALILLITFGIGSYGIYRYKMRWYIQRSVIPQYEPYPDFKPMYAGFIFDMRLDARDVAAAMVYLAQQGFLKIKQIDRKVLFFFEVDDYELTLCRPVEELSGAFEQTILGLIFKEGTSVGDMVTLSTLRNDMTHTRNAARLMQGLIESLIHDLREQGFYKGGSLLMVSTVMRFILAMFVAFFFAGIMTTFVALPAIVLFPPFFILGLCGFLLTSGRRTRKGFEALEHLKGFRDYLRVTEKDRYLFHNAPERNAEQFMEYLPYAIAFGVEKEWAKAFSEIPLLNPDWYEGEGGAALSAITLSKSMGGFGEAITRSTHTGTSAASGGGFSGGGTGGGGGGSW